MRAAVVFAMAMIPTAVLAQDTPAAKRPNVGGKPLVQVKPSGPAGCKLVGMVKGTKLWAGDCVASELSTSTDEASPKSLSEQAAGAIPKGAQ
jgi:hypothetical protein